MAPAAAHAQSACCYPQRAEGLELSPDDNFVYAVSDVTVALRRDPATGALDVIDIEDPPGDGALIPPDGRHVYVQKSIFDRDQASGMLTYRGDSEGPWIGSSDLAAFRDDRTLYMRDAADALKVYDRDPESGAITVRPDSAAGVPGSHGRGLGGVVLSPDRRWLYALVTKPQDGIAAFRVLEGGGLEAAPDADCACLPYGGYIAMSPDGSRIAAGMNNMITTVERDPDGRLHSPRTVGDLPMERGNHVFTRDSRSLLAVEDNWGHSGQLVQYDNLADGLKRRRTYGPNDGVVGPLTVATSQDGRHVYVGGGTDITNPSTISVFGWNEAGELVHLSTTSPPIYSGRPFGGPPASVTINGGADYTNDPHVELTFAGLGRRDDTIELSNDGGFKPSETRYFALGRTEPWRLASTGPDRLPKTVYVRVRGSVGVETLRDDIVLDESAPTLVSARRDGKKLRVKARDRISGVSHIQVTRDPRKPGEWRRFKSRTAIPKGRGAIRVRARDRARNKSRWVIAR